MGPMKTWQETARVYSELAGRLADGRATAVATLVRLEGSSYRRPGAKLLIGDDGALVGNVSGGCLEEDLRERGRRALATGKPEAVHYDTGSDENVVWGLGLGCDGRLDLWLQPFRPGDQTAAIEAVRERLRGDQPFAIRLSLTDGELHVVEVGEKSVTGLIEESPARYFLDVLHPPPDLVVVGAGEDARPLVRLAAEVGFRVTVVDHRNAFLAADRFPAAHRRIQARPEGGLRDLPARANTLVVLMTHAVKLDKAWAQAYAATPVAYLGLLGPQARRDEILAQLPASARAQAYGPIGLDVGAEGVEQIAVSIVAEALAVQAGRTGGSLRERTKPLHGGSAPKP